MTNENLRATVKDYLENLLAVKEFRRIRMDVVSKESCSPDRFERCIAMEELHMSIAQEKLTALMVDFGYLEE